MKLIPKSLDISHIGDIITHESTTSEVRITDGFLLAGTVMLASLNSAILHGTPFSEKGKVFGFNFLCSCVWTLILILLGGRLSLSVQTLFFGVLYAAVQIVFLVFKSKAMSLGPISLTTLIGNMSLLLSTVCGVVFWHENCGVFQIFGIALLVAATVICTYKKDTLTFGKGWGFYVVGFFVSAAGIGLVFKAFSKSGGNTGDMMLTAAVIMTIITGAITFANRSLFKSMVSDRRFLLTSAACGVVSCLYNRINIYLSGAIDSVIFFPTFNGGVIILSTIIGTVVFKERLSVRQKAGILTGVAAIIIIGVLK